MTAISSQLRQLGGLVKVNDVRIQKKENEILKLTNKKRSLLEDLEAKEQVIQQIVNEKNVFKHSYFEGKTVLSTDQIRFFRTSLEVFDSRITHAKSEKDRVQKEIDAVQQSIDTCRKELKGHTIKNEKYDFLMGDMQRMAPMPRG